MIESLGVGGRITAGCPANRFLIDVDDLVDGFQTFDTPVRADAGIRSVQVAGQCRIENLIYQGGFAGPRYTGHRHQ